MSPTRIDRALGVTAAAGFTAAGVAAGIKASGAPDLALVVGPEGTVAAGAFTTNAVVAAPVVWTRERLAGAADARVVVLNAGNANACTGAAGVATVERTAAAAAERLGCRSDQVLVCSTGVIGVPLAAELVEAGIGAAAAELSPEGGARAAGAILTTDTRTKQAGLRLADGVVAIGGMAKGAAMLAPVLAVPQASPQALPQATMLAVVTTDAMAEPAELRAACAAAVAGSFNAITVDGAQSTNDTVLVLASGASGVRVAAAELAAALAAVCDDLAGQMLADAEGGTKVFTVAVGGADSLAGAHAVARKVADSPLVKAAVYGGDPNWGRIMAAAGAAGVPFDPDRARLVLHAPDGAPSDGVTLFDRGVPVPLDEARAAEVAKLMAAPELVFALDLGGSAPNADRGVDPVREGPIGPWARVRSADLTTEYVRLNAEYTT
jgi:glutamate N-acetyltransferase / amino-acid N-acetyltransferase